MKPRPFSRFLALVPFLAAFAPFTHAQSPTPSPASADPFAPSTATPASAPALHPPLKERTYAENLDLALASAVSRGRTDYAARLIELGADPNQSQPAGKATLLGQAVQNGDAPMVELLLKEGADPNAMDARNETALNFVFTPKVSPETWLKIFHLLLKGGVDINNTGKNTYPVAFSALNTSNYAVFEDVIHSGPNLDALTPGRQTTAEMAAKRGWQKYVDALTAAGANFTPTLFSAAGLGDLAKVNELLAAGAEVNAGDQIDTPAIGYAAQSGHESVVEALLAAGSDKDTLVLSRALRRAVSGNQTEIVDTLIRAGANISFASGTTPTTPLYVAAINGNLTLVQRLYGEGVNLDGALIGASEKGQPDVVAYLIDKGADARETRPGQNHIIPLSAAAALGHDAVVSVLLNKTTGGYEPAELDQALQSAVLGYCAYLKRAGTVANLSGPEIGEGYRRTIALLTEHGATTVNQGPTVSLPFAQALYSGNVELVQTLLDHAHANPIPSDKSSFDPLQGIMGNDTAALRPTQVQLMALLIDHGADPSREHGDPNLATKGWGVTNRLDDALLSLPPVNRRAAVQLLLAHGANFRTTGGNESEDLLLAVAAGDQAKAQAALAAGANVNQKARNGWTPYLVACAEGNLEMAQWLLAHKANPDETMTITLGLKAGLGALFLAGRSDNPELIRFIYKSMKSPGVEREARLEEAIFSASDEDCSAGIAAMLALSSHPDLAAELVFKSRPTNMNDAMGPVLAALHRAPPDNPSPTTPPSNTPTVSDAN